jgi:hypothetical protein
MAFPEGALLRFRFELRYFFGFATSDWFKGKARRMIADALNALKPKIEGAKVLQEPQRRELLKVLAGEAQMMRHEALRAGATDFAQPQWAAAAACESWLLELLSGTPESIARVEALIDEMLRARS